VTSNRRLSDLVDEWDPVIRRAFLESVQAIRDQAQIGAIARKLEAGDIEGALEAVGLDPALFRPLDRAIAEAFEDGGGFTLRSLPALREAGQATVRIVFDIRNTRAEAWLKRQSGTLIREIVDDQRTMIREHLRAGMEAGINPRDVALDLAGRIDPGTKARMGGALGLTSSQEQWVRNFRAKLSDPARVSEALANKLRDKRFDTTIAKAAKNGNAIPSDKIEAMVRAYRRRALRFRAEGIAKTEALRSLNGAAEEATRQAIDGGQLEADAVEKVWIATSDGRTRDSHKAMNGQAVRFNGSFVSPSGARLAYPGDPNAPAEETVNCRCTFRTKINYTRGLR
jgi:hypothetical protein